jgi:hypothetical protein
MEAPTEKGGNEGNVPVISALCGLRAGWAARGVRLV